MKEVFLVKSPGPFTTVQDAGRFSYLHMGVPVSGALDSLAYLSANLLVGNAREAAALEITLSGPRLEVLDEADIAVTGADMEVLLNGVPCAMWRSVRVKRGDILNIGRAKTGCRAYLAVTGGIDVPLVMGSRSTYASGNLGGFEGRKIQAGDILPMGPGDLLKKQRRLPWFPRYSNSVMLRAIPGPEDDYFKGSLDLFFSSTFTVSPQADRMGYRLQGPAVERDPEAPLSIISEPSVHGNVQIPADNQPIILMVEQTIGGYAKIATVITPDLFKIAQAKPGDSVRFSRTPLEEAHETYRNWSKFIAAIDMDLETCE